MTTMRDIAARVWLVARGRRRWRMMRIALGVFILSALTGCPADNLVPADGWSPDDAGDAAARDFLAEPLPACVDAPPPADLIGVNDGGLDAAPPTCSDFVQNQDETGVDCGGACRKCSGASCGADSECAGGRCRDGACAGCSDGVKNADETDVDCGGAACVPCKGLFGDRCTQPGDCASGLCDKSLCRAPSSCSNQIRDGLETDVDCGGRVCSACRAGKHCRFDRECTSEKCTAGRCSTCGDGIRNGDENGVDCGGSCPTLCGLDGSCRSNLDCAMGECYFGQCRLRPRCGNKLLDCDESDVDCGGTCMRCGEGRRCFAGSDCLSGVCASGRCTASTCPAGTFKRFDGWCWCDSTTCDGCCDFTIKPTCIRAADVRNARKCGSNGESCGRCPGVTWGGTACYGTTCYDPGYIVCQNGCYWHGFCVVTATPRDCGTKGSDCVNCDEGKLCENGACQ